MKENPDLMEILSMLLLEWPLNDPLDPGPDPDPLRSIDHWGANSPELPIDLKF